jgi:hypothetical protein
MFELLKRTLKTVTILSLIVIAIGMWAQPAHARLQLRSVPVGGLVFTPAPPPPSVTEQSFFVPTWAAKEMTHDFGWTGENPRMLADVNGDRKQDIVGFGYHGVWFATAGFSGFSPLYVLADFGYQSGWRAAKHVRTTGDINGDGFEDVVGFGDAGVYRALSTATGITGANFVVADFGYDQGWRVEKHVRLLADVNGDGRKDIVAFGDHGVWVSVAAAGGYFIAPAFVLADFGYNQGWRLEKHIRTTADVNGDGRQDIVAFGDHGVWIALSTGSSFGPAQYVLAEFGYFAGNWRLQHHTRLLADIDRDGRQDIVAFGNDGVWTARSNGAGFAAAQFVLADFGYNQGWRVERHPRFVADLNGDGYQDIVGYGEEAVYRALGGPGWFGGIRAMLRDLVAAEPPAPYSSDFYVRSDLFPRFVGDVNADGMHDLIAFRGDHIEVSRSSALPPPPPPAAPTNPRITGSTTSTLSIAWDDNSSERRFFVTYSKVGDSGSIKTITVGSDVTSYTLGSLASNSNYCFRVQAEDIFGVSPTTTVKCGVTKAEPKNTGPFTFTMYMQRQEVTQGPVPYKGSFGPFYDGATITNINFPTQYPAVLLVRPQHSTSECYTNPAAVIQVSGDMTPDQKKAIWGSATPIISGYQTLNFVGCTTSGQLLNTLPVNITYTRP